MKNQALFLILRRMRVPLLVLISAYSISVLGLVLMPGVDASGKPAHLSFFHAFYIITYTATTTGFGELPYAFSNAQRMWVTFALYLSVVGWIYAIGALISLFQDSAFRAVITANRFASSVRRLHEPFYIVCGYGDTGRLVVGAMVRRGIAVVVIDSNQDHINELSLENLSIYVPGLCADAGLPGSLLAAGLAHEKCAGVIALSDSDQVNLKVAITSKLLNQDIMVISRAQTHDTQANMVSFGTDAVINPFDTFADRFAMALHSPDMHLIYEWLTAIPGAPLRQRLNPPHGTWVVCGYGRFGKAVSRYLQFEGLSTVIVESDPQTTHAPSDAIIGRGTEAVTLREAHIEDAVGIVAGTDDDANNLSIILTARTLNPALFMVARQNLRENDPIFDVAKLDLVMQRSRIIARRILSLITSPLLTDFLRLARHMSNDWARDLAASIRPLTRNVVPDLWAISITPDSAVAVHAALAEGRDIRLRHIMVYPGDRTRPMACLPLLHMRGEQADLLPPGELRLQTGDQILFCGRLNAAGRMRRILMDYNVLRYIETGEVRPDGYFWRWLAARNSKPA